MKAAKKEKQNRVWRYLILITLVLVILLPTYSAAMAEGVQVISFQGAVNYKVSTNPYGVAIGDLNGDKKNDIIVSNGYGGNICVLLNDGNGTFKNPVYYFVGDWPAEVGIGDFNLDEKPDIVVANSGSGSVSVLMNKGNGTFNSSVNYTVGGRPKNLALGDFNCDGKLDFAVTGYRLENISILQNNGNGTFKLAGKYASDLFPRGIAVGDFNSDGKPDMAIGDGKYNSLWILWNDGSGGFQKGKSYRIGWWAFNFPVAVGDFNGDGSLDIATADSSSKNVSILLNKGSGDFSEPVNYSTDAGTSSIMVADFDGDRMLDIAVSNYLADNISVLRNSGDGTFEKPINYVTNSHPITIATGDLNGDGMMDLVTANQYSNNISVFMNKCSPPSDIINPETIINLDGTMGKGGWYVSDVKVTLTATDEGSGVAETKYSLDGLNWTSYIDSFNVNMEGTNTLYYHSVDKSGNTEEIKSIVINIDKAPPIITGDASTSPNSNGWYKSDVTIHFEAFDKVSGVDNVMPDSIISKEGADQSLTGTAVDKAGNSASYTVSGIKIDKTSPVTAVNLTGTTGYNGWYSSNVAIELSANDLLSGVDVMEYSMDGISWTEYTGNIIITDEGTNKVYYRSRDKAGNIEITREETIKIDKTRPRITGWTLNQPNEYGWYSDDVTVHFTALDDESGIWFVTPDITISTEGAEQSVAGVATDRAGNSTTFTVRSINIDKTAPEVNLNIPSDGSKYILNENVSANWTARDVLAGINAVEATGKNGQSIDTGSVGQKEFTIRVTDRAGNETFKSVKYYVCYDYSGILPPYKDGAAYKMGRSIPVKFQLKDFDGNYITGVKAEIYVAKIDENVPGLEIPGTSTSKALKDNRFRYESSENLYIFNLDTKGLSAGTWRLILKFDDGTTKYSNIELQ